MSYKGLLNNFCNILGRITEQDGESGEIVQTFETLAENVPCAFQRSSGSIDNSSRLRMAGNVFNLYIEPLTFDIVRHQMAVEVNGIKYNISDFEDMGGRFRYTKLVLEREALND